MSISRQNLSAVIVTLKSENVIHECIKSINQNIPIIVVENSNNQRFKEDLESQYENLKCILSKSLDAHQLGTDGSVGKKVVILVIRNVQNALITSISKLLICNH